MKSNSKVIGVVVCIVCCIGALCILPLVNTNESDSLGWNPSSVYDGVICPSNGVFTDAVLEEQHGGSSTFAPRVSSTGSRMFHHTGASSLSAPMTTSSYAGASVHTTSSAMMGGTGSSISPISTSTARSSMGGASNGGGAIYATSGSVSRSGNYGGAMTSSSMSAPVAAAPMMTSTPSSLYSMRRTSNFGYSTMMNSGIARIGGLDGSGNNDLGNTMFGAFFTWLIEQSTDDNPTYLYGGMAADKYETTGQEYWWFLESDIYGWWLKYCEQEGMSEDEAKDLWDSRFYQWFNDKESNTTYRFPIPDGVGVLLVLSLLCALFTFLRERDKKAEAVEEQQS